jgi:FixJ family two-component response regulator
MLVYIVDDQIDIAEALGEGLKFKENIDAKCFTNLDDCLVEVQKNKPDLIVCDVHMPTGSGLRLSEELNKSHLNIPHIYFSGMVDKLPPLENAYLVRKPVKIDELIDKIKSIL